METEFEDSKPLYPINVAAEVCGTTPRMLREYEKAGFIKPARINSQRRYSNNDIQFIKNIRFYLEKVGMTITGLKLLYMMAPCWEIKQCGRQGDCPAYGATAKKCWEAIAESGQTDMRTCYGCPIYLTYDKNKDMKIHQGRDIGPRCLVQSSGA
ncbi:MAG: MerR family transcriptional regulator [Nitrospinae bacterium]|nr:MerR family transcriptional regulator [Nitrospinota bacterium]